MSLLKKLGIEKKERFPIGVPVKCTIIVQTTQTHWKVLFRIPEHEDFIWFIPARKCPNWIKPMVESSVGLDLTEDYDYNLIDEECVEVHSLYRESKKVGKMDKVVRIDWFRPINWEIRIEENNRMKRVV